MKLDRAADSTCALWMLARCAPFGSSVTPIYAKSWPVHRFFARDRGRLVTMSPELAMSASIRQRFWIQLSNFSSNFRHTADSLGFIADPVSDAGLHPRELLSTNVAPYQRNPFVFATGNVGPHDHNKVDMRNAERYLACQIKLY